MTPLHSCMRSTKNILKASFKKRSNTHNISIKQAKQQICYKIKEATGARLFEPEPKTGGNSNTGGNLKIILDESTVTHEILDCSEEFLVTLKQLLDRVESLEMQQPQLIEFLCEKTYFLYMKEFGDHYAISPSFHRVLYHFIEFLDFFQSQGISFGELSEQAIEASNYDSKQNVLKH